MKVLVVDIGGTQVKVIVTGQTEPRRFDSHIGLTAREAVQRVLNLVRDWNYDVVTLGFPGYTGFDGPEQDPGKLGPDWVGFDFEAAFRKPTIVVNDAAMQALGAYEGGRMLYLGLGTGLGSALVCDSVVIPLELGDLAWPGDHTLGELLGSAGRKNHGQREWMRVLTLSIENLKKAMKADYVVLGGGNSRNVDPLPNGVRRGGNEDAFRGGFLLWHEDVHNHGPNPDHWRFVR